MKIHVPQDAGIDTVVGVTKVISNIGDLTPRDVGVLLPLTLWNMLGCLADHLQKSLERRAPDAILFHVFEPFSIEEHPYILDRLMDVAQTKGSPVDH